MKQYCICLIILLAFSKQGECQLHESDIKEICASRYYLDYINPSINRHFGYKLKRSDFEIIVTRVFEKHVVYPYAMYCCEVTTSHSSNSYYCINVTTGDIIDGVNLLEFNAVFYSLHSVTRQQIAFFHYVSTFLKSGITLINQDTVLSPLIIVEHQTPDTLIKLFGVAINGDNQISLRIRVFNQNTEKFNYGYIFYKFVGNRLKDFRVEIDEK
jgi:hypothetical protein